MVVDELLVECLILHRKIEVLPMSQPYAHKVFDELSQQQFCLNFGLIFIWHVRHAFLMLLYCSIHRRAWNSWQMRATKHQSMLLLHKCFTISHVTNCGFTMCWQIWPPQWKNTPSISKGKEKVAGSSRTAWTRLDDRGMRRFLTIEHKARFSNVISRWKVWPERKVIVEDFGRFELTRLICLAGWEKITSEPQKVYPTLVQEFYANFNEDLDTPETEHMHQTWVWDKWCFLQKWLRLTMDWLEIISSLCQWIQICQLFCRCYIGEMMRGHLEIMNLNNDI